LGRVSKDEAIEANLIGKIRCPNKASTRHRVGRNPGRRRFDGVDANHGITFMGASIAIATMMGMSPGGGVPIAAHFARDRSRLQRHRAGRDRGKTRRIFDPGLIETFWAFSNDGRSSSAPHADPNPDQLWYGPLDTHDLLFLSRTRRLPRRGKCLSQNAADHAGGVCGIPHHWPGFAGVAAAPALHAGHEPGGCRRCDRQPVSSPRCCRGPGPAAWRTRAVGNAPLSPAC